MPGLPNLFQLLANRRAGFSITPGDTLFGYGGRHGLTGFRNPAICGVFVLLLFSVRRFSQKPVDEGILFILAGHSFGNRDISGLLFLLLFLHLPLNLTLDLTHIHMAQVEAFKDAVDLGSIISPNHNVGQAIRSILILQHTVKDTILLRFPAENLQFIVLHGENLQGLFAAEHRTEPGFALSSLLVLHDGVDHSSQLLYTLAGQLERILNALQGHSHDLFCRVVGRIHAVYSPFLAYSSDG